ncbi:hypothetical protein ACJ6YJ_26980 [Pseudomonas marginalis]|uniref:hypothetical protein n=1 Tax=Pseudomonas TaxID=286 RepID=UPI003899C4BD
MSADKTPGSRRLHNGILRLADIRVPILDDVVPPIMEGYIPHQYLDSDLEVVIPELWEDAAQAGEFNIVEIVWSRSGGEGVAPFEERWDGPITKEFPFPISVSRDYLENDGTVRLAYRITDEGGLPTTSEFRTLVLDRSPPNNNVTPPSPAFPVGLIDEGYLATHPTVDLVVPPYNGRRSWDRIYYWITDKNPPPDTAPSGYVEFPFEDTPLVLPVPGDLFRLYPNGTQYVHIRLQDRSSNRGPRCEQSPVEVQLSAVPSDLQPLVIPAMASGLINRHDARIGVVAKVQYDNWQAGDRVAVRWGKTVLTRQSVPELPFDVVIPWPRLIEDGLGLAEGVATYTITRSGSDTPTPPSPPALIRWDFRVAGQDHLDAPALLNLNLPRVTVWGEGSMTENHIDRRDEGKRVYASVPLYHQPRTGEVLELYWGDFPSMDNPIAHYVVDTDKGDAEGVRVEFSDIPWEVIVGAGNEEKMQVYYTTFNGVNEQLSNFTEVNVDVVPPLVFQRVEYPSANDNLFINCGSSPAMWDHIPIRILPEGAFRKDDDLVVTWQGYEEFGGGGKAITLTADTLTHRLTEQQAQEGYTFKQSNYEEKIKPIRSPHPNSPGSSVGVTYTLWRKKRIIGSSRERYAKIDQKYSGGSYCGPDGEDSAGK